MNQCSSGAVYTCSAVQCLLWSQYFTPQVLLNNYILLNLSCISQSISHFCKLWWSSILSGGESQLSGDSFCVYSASICFINICCPVPFVGKSMTIVRCTMLIDVGNLKMSDGMSSHTKVLMKPGRYKKEIDLFGILKWCTIILLLSEISKTLISEISRKYFVHCTYTARTARTVHSIWCGAYMCHPLHKILRLFRPIITTSFFYSRFFCSVQFEYGRQTFSQLRYVYGYVFIGTYRSCFA